MNAVKDASSWIKTEVIHELALKWIEYQPKKILQHLYFWSIFQQRTKIIPQFPPALLLFLFKFLLEPLEPSQRRDYV